MRARHTAIAGFLIAVSSAVAVAADSLRISSPSFENNSVMPPQFTCEGAGLNPTLQFDGVPAAAKSLALIVVDSDVPRLLKSDGRYLHWALWDLPPGTARIVEGLGPRGLNENGAGGYIPACPPDGEHRYMFQLFALDILPGSTRIASEAELRRAMKGHILDQAELVGRYTTRSGRIVRVVLAAIAVIVLLAVFLVVRRLARRRRPLPSKV